MLQAQALTIAVEGRLLVRQLDLQIGAGEFVCILGTNGVGKTLTLQTLAGLRNAASGTITIAGTPLAQLERKTLARHLGLLLQHHEDAFPTALLDAVLMGRYAHLPFWRWPAAADQHAARAALQTLDLAGLEERAITALSGGERQRAAIATLMLQDPELWLLDEPANHLDPKHQLGVFTELRRRADAGRGVLASVHNPALAMRYADSVLLLFGAGDWEYGPASELLEPERLERMYGTPFRYFAAPSDATGPEQQLLFPA